LGGGIRIDEGGSKVKLSHVCAVRNPLSRPGMARLLDTGAHRKGELVVKEGREIRRIWVLERVLFVPAWGSGKTIGRDTGYE